MTPYGKIVAGAGLGFGAAVLSDVTLWLRTPGGWKKNKFDFDVASKRWVLGAISGAISAAGIHLAGM